MASTGRLAACRPRTRQAWMAAEEFNESDPPRNMTALPAARQSAPASAVTFGRLSKITPMTPSGVRTRSIFRPLGRSHAAWTWLIVAGVAAIWRTPSAMAPMRSGVSFRRSRKEPASLACVAFSMSIAFAARIAFSSATMASAMASRALRFADEEAFASGLAAARARRPNSTISRVTSSPFSCSLSMADPILRGVPRYDKVVAVDHGRPRFIAEHGFDLGRFLPCDPYGIGGVVGNQSPRDLVPVRGEHRHGIAA